MITYRKAAAADWPAIAALLTAASLPLDGARDHIDGFLLAFRGDELVGSIALERYSDTALLRSAAVAASERGNGLGQELTRLILDQAYAEGLKSVVLLTTTADRFFPRFGFRRITRDEVPEGALASVEFKGACPASSVIMHLGLQRSPVLVRPATEADIPAITRAYNQGIEDRATLETQLRTEEERLNWLKSRDPRHPVVVAVQQGEVKGWASLNPFNPREAYRWVADLSVYIDRSARGTGLGTLLMEDLMDRARALEYHKLVLTTFPQLRGAVRLYEKLGFRHVGDYKEQGLLDGIWRDTRIMEYIL